MNIDPSIRKLLDNEATIHEAQIRALFQTLDRRFWASWSFCAYPLWLR